MVCSISYSKIEFNTVRLSVAAIVHDYASEIPKIVAKGDENETA